MKTTLYIIILAIALISLFQWMNAKDEALNKLSNCISNTAQTEGYKGNPHSREAWTLFASSCTK